MNIQCPPLHSVWEDIDGSKWFVDEITEVDGTFFASVVPYGERDDMSAIAEELDADEWQAFSDENVLNMIGIEPRNG